VCDLVHLERRGIPAVGIATAPFADEAVQQARLLGMPGCRMAYIPHPVQLLSSCYPAMSWPGGPTRCFPTCSPR